MSNLKNLKTKHYISKILKTKKLKINNKTYIGFNIIDLLIFKWYQKNPKIDFNFKGLSYINIKNIPESTLQSI